MPTLTMKATEMKKAQVVRISLVERAASRIPFRVTKQEKPMNIANMVDLASVFKREKPAATQAEIVGVVTMKSEKLADITAQITEAGFAVEKSEVMEDGSVVFAQAEDLTGEASVVRISDDAAIVVKGLRPYSMDITTGDGTTFADMCKAQGFYPGVGTMVDVLRNSVLTVAEKSDNPGKAATAVSKMFDEAKAYAVSLVNALPSKAFKLEFVGTDPEPAPAVKAEGEPEADPEGEAAAGGDPEVKPEDAAAAATGEQAPVAKAEADTKLDALLASVQALGDKINGMETSVTSVNKSVKDLTDRVQEAEQVAKSAREAVEGTVVMGGDAGDSSQTARKSDRGQYRGREIDTGFSPRPARR